ncbi:hypothetical protein Tco_1427640 [Tanacetum coccineum]
MPHESPPQEFPHTCYQRKVNKAGEKGYSSASQKKNSDWLDAEAGDIVDAMLRNFECTLRRSAAKTKDKALIWKNNLKENRVERDAMAHEAATLQYFKNEKTYTRIEAMKS